MYEDNFLSGVRVAQLATGTASTAACEAIDLAGQMALQLGAEVLVDAHFATDNNFVSRGKVKLTEDPAAWLASDTVHFALSADPATAQGAEHANVVTVNADPLCNEAVLFADSGLADLLGDPASAPIIPTGSYGAGTAAYGILAALAALVALRRRYGVGDTAAVDAAGVLGWVNWKAAAAGVMGKDIHRQGDNAEWPVIPCKDGYAALVYQERDWPNLVSMVGDKGLEDERFSNFAGREAARSDYMEIIRRWAAGLTKSEINAAFLEYDIPAAPVMDAKDLLNDPLLNHRQAFRRQAFKEAADGGQHAVTPRLAHRVIHRSSEATASPDADASLPLSGFRVLDLGIITAGAGVSALLADLGAEVIKVESHTYPDPFRRWAGQAVSPLFKCNNRNKYAVALDLKNPADKGKFLELVAQADVVVENFRRGVLERLGLGYDSLRAANPRIMLASISGQGLTGPGCGSSSFGSTLEASSGFSAHISYADGAPYITGRNVNYPDQTVVLYAAAVITAALSSANRGMQLDVSQRDVAVFLAGGEIERASSGREADARDNGRAYLSRDNRWVAFQPSPEVCDSIGASNLEEWCRTQDAADLVRKLRDSGCGAAVVRSGSDMYAHFARQDIFSRSPDGALVKGFPFQLDQHPMSVRLNSPEVGEHTTQFCTSK